MDVLTKKSYKQYDKVSRYQEFPYYYHTFDDKYVYGTTSWLKDNTPYQLYTVVQGDNLDKLALKFYSNPTRFWVIADFNRINDPLEPLVIGQQLKIPVFSSIEFTE